MVLDWQPRGLRSLDLTAKYESADLEQRSPNLARSFENMNNRLLNFFSRAAIDFWFAGGARSAAMHL